MLQAVMIEPGKIEFQHVEKPSPKAGEVLIEVKRIGVCGSDIHVYHGLHPGQSESTTVLDQFAPCRV